ncbi:hypothetical protein [Nocardia mangyaensis]|uniref:hypothetical protein n=1 Tax=Nocardia mangyaensis TaxID=2213200 RepID=UPI0012EC67B7|nr:hypothetical protein [Nocardia mangyaensis]
MICTPSCEDRDGHPLALFREDQICFGTPHPTPLSLEDAERSGDQERAAYVETYTQRHPGGEPSVHLYAATVRDDMWLDLTPDEALKLAESLTAVATLVRADAIPGERS